MLMMTWKALFPRPSYTSCDSIDFKTRGSTMWIMTWQAFYYRSYTSRDSTKPKKRG